MATNISLLGQALRTKDQLLLDQLLTALVDHQDNIQLACESFEPEQAALLLDHVAASLVSTTKQADRDSKWINTLLATFQWDDVFRDKGSQALHALASFLQLRKSDLVPALELRSKLAGLEQELTRNIQFKAILAARGAKLES